MAEGSFPQVKPAWSMFDVNRYIVRGRVQGVGFRWWTHRQACTLRIVGSVRNLPDGSVEVIAGGDSWPLADFAESLEVGPPGAKVESVEMEPVPVGSIPVPSSFEILRG